MGSIRGRVVDGADPRANLPTDGPPPSISIRLLRLDGSSLAEQTVAGPSGGYEFLEIPAGWYLLYAMSRRSRQSVKAVRVVEGDAPTDAGSINLLGAWGAWFLEPTPVLSAGQAMDNREEIQYASVVIVGIFKSGMDESLQLDWNRQPVTDDIGWPVSIGLSKPSMPPDSLRDQVEKKRQEILKSAPPEAQLRPERVVGLHGRFVSLAGLSSAECCHAVAAATFPPARLFGIDETGLFGIGLTDMPVIR